MTEGFDRDHRKVFRAVREANQVEGTTRRRIEAATGLYIATVLDCLHALRKAGLVEKTGAGSSLRYRVGDGEMEMPEPEPEPETPKPKLFDDIDASDIRRARRLARRIRS